MQKCWEWLCCWVCGPQARRSWWWTRRLGSRVRRLCSSRRSWRRTTRTVLFSSITWRDAEEDGLGIWTSTSRRTTAPWVYLCGTRLDRLDAAGARWSWPSAHTGPTSTRSDSLTHTLSTKLKNPYIYGKKRQHFYCKKYGSNIWGFMVLT